MSEDSDLRVNAESKLKLKSVCAVLCMCSTLSCEDEYLDGELCKGEIEKCICKLKNNRTGGVMV